MMNKVRLAAIFAFTAVLSQPLRADENLEWTYKVHANGQPAVGAKVTIVEFGHTIFDSKPIATIETTVDATGIARMPCSKEIKARYARFTVRDATGKCGYGTVTFVGYSHPKSIDLRPTTTLTGRITDAAGQPIPGLKLKPVALGPESFASFGDRAFPLAQTPDSFWAGYPIQLAADGTFQVPGVAMQHSVAVEFDARSVGKGKFWIQPGQPAEIRLPHAGVVHLKFNVPANIKLQNQQVEARRDEGPEHGYLQVIAEATSVNGEAVTFHGLPPGKYQFSFPYAGPADHYPQSVEPCVVAADATIGRTSNYEPAVRVLATLLDSKTNKGVAGAEVFVTCTATSNPQQTAFHTKSSDDGTIDVRAPAGLVSIRPMDNERYAVLKFNHGLFSNGATDAIPIAAGKSHDFGKFAMVSKIDFTGIVVDEKDQPVAGAQVLVGDSGENFYFGSKITSDAQGRFVIRGMNPEGGLFGVTAKKGAQITAQPLAVDPSAGTELPRVVVSERFAAYVRARAVNRAGQPITGAAIERTNSVTYLKRGPISGSGFGSHEGVTGTDGEYRSEALQAGNRTYGLQFSAPGYRTAKTPPWEAKAGATKDFGDVVMWRSDCVVKGIVVDRQGNPIAGASVFSNADGPRATRTTSDAAGRFTLGGLFDGAAFVSARAPGFVLGSLPVQANGPDVKLALRRSTELPDPPPVISDEYRAASAKLARHIAEGMWNNRVAAKDDGAAALRAMARIDPATARRWRDEEKARSNNDMTGELAKVERNDTIEAVARRDPDEAIAMMKPVEGIEGFRAVCKLCETISSDAPASAARLAEECVARARGMSGENRGWTLAEAGEMVYRTGLRDAGRKIIEEAAADVEKVPVGGIQGYRRGMIAARLAYFDPARARQLIDPMTEAIEFNRWLGAACIRAAMTDLPLAKKWLNDFRPDNSFHPHQARQHIAFRLAKSHPAEAIALVESIEDRTCRAIGCAELASKLADRTLAIQLIDRTVGRVIADSSQYFTNNAGGAGTIALMAYHAKQIGHPDLASLRDCVYAARPAANDHPFGNEFSPDVRLSLALALIDPSAARQLLDRALPGSERLKIAELPGREPLLTIAIVDPADAIANVDRVIAAAVKQQKGFETTALPVVAAILTQPNKSFEYVCRYGNFSGYFEEE